MRPILVLALARPTFDVPYAEDFAARAFAALDAAGLATLGPRILLFDAASARAAIAGVAANAISGVLLLQVTFTDASMTVEIAKSFPNLPLGIWAFPEPRSGGRLRLNSFCGLNLAVHALGRADHAVATLYAPPDDAGIGPQLRSLLMEQTLPPSRRRAARNTGSVLAAAIDKRLAGNRIGLIGEPPVGFDTCRFEPASLKLLADVSVEPITLTDAFERARAVDAPTRARQHADAIRDYQGVERLDPEQLDKSMAFQVALQELRTEKSLDAFAVRCWPETFTEYGCAICAPMGALTEAGIPCACEADVLGALSSLVLQAAADAPAWLVDIVDIDAADDTGVFWHCGSAPLSMRDPDTLARAQIHSNRKMALLAEFTLKPGRITIARLSQARNHDGKTSLSLVLGGGAVIAAPMSFTGTSAVVRFDGGAANAAEVLLGEGLEHHVAMVYGEHRPALEAWAARNTLAIIDLTLRLPDMP